MFADLVGNVDRRGLDKDITRYQDSILEGWHRYLACLATKRTPKFIDFKGTDLEAAELVHASELRRHSTAEQRYASFDLLCDACPDFKAKYEALKAKGEQQQKEGKPLDTDAQRVDVVGSKAEAAGVSKTTAKKVERVKRHNPGAVAEIAAGKTTANKEMKKLPKKAKNAKNHKVEDNEEEQAEVSPDAATVYTAQVAGSRSFFIHPESGYDEASVLHLLQTGRAFVKDDFAYLGDKKIAQLEMKEDQLEYSDFHAILNEPPLEQIAALSSETAATPVLCLPDPGTETVALDDSHPQAISLPFDPHFDEKLDLK